MSLVINRCKIFGGGGNLDIYFEIENHITVFEDQDRLKISFQKIRKIYVASFVSEIHSIRMVENRKLLATSRNEMISV